MAVDLDAPLIASRRPCRGTTPPAGEQLNVSSIAALHPLPGIMSYGIAKIGLERLTVDLARQLHPTASPGTASARPGGGIGRVRRQCAERRPSGWEPCEVAAEGICWMIAQPASYAGRRESMAHLALRENIMAKVAARRSRCRRPRCSTVCSTSGTRFRGRTRDHGRAPRSWRGSASAELGSRLPSDATKHRPRP